MLYHRFLPAALFVTVLGVGANVVTARQPRGVVTVRPLENGVIVSTDWLARHISDPDLVVLRVSHLGEPAEELIPGTRDVSYMDIIETKDGNSTELPSVPTLKNLFENLGVSNGSHVVLYGEPMMAARAFFTLDYLGLDHVSVLNGGIDKWKAENRPLTRKVVRPGRGQLQPHPRPEIVANADWILAHEGQPGVALIDTRTDGEYVGAGERHGMPSEGHIAGAKQLQWEQLFSDPATGRFLESAGLRQLYAARIKPGDTVVTYCFVGMRASVTYLAARAIGLVAKMYDGSYQDWSQRHLPLSRAVER
jgi:thiosulfate/3-mercaptopyruvate sulfurtransferase